MGENNERAHLRKDKPHTIHAILPSPQILGRRRMRIEARGVEFPLTLDGQVVG